MADGTGHGRLLPKCGNSARQSKMSLLGLLRVFKSQLFGRLAKSGQSIEVLGKPESVAWVACAKSEPVATLFFFEDALEPARETIRHASNIAIRHLGRPAARLTVKSSFAAAGVKTNMVNRRAPELFPVMIWLAFGL